MSALYVQRRRAQFAEWFFLCRMLLDAVVVCGKVATRCVEGRKPVRLEACKIDSAGSLLLLVGSVEMSIRYEV